MPGHETLVNWHLNDQWTINAGIRYTYEEKDFVGSDSQDFQRGEALPNLNFTSLEDDWTEISPKIGVSYKRSDDMLLFASVTQGFKSGEFFGRNTDFEGAKSYDPEFVDTWELGMKSQWLANRLIFNATLFYSRYDDKQEEVLIETGPGVVATNVLNASTVDIAGVDLELQYKLTEAWSVRAAYGYLDAEFDEFTADLDGDGETPATDNTDLKLRNAPENTFGLSTTYTVPIGPGKFYAYASYRFRMR